MDFSVSRAAGRYYSPIDHCRDMDICNDNMKTEPEDDSDFVSSIKFEADVEIHEELRNSVTEQELQFISDFKQESGMGFDEKEPERILPDWPEEESTDEPRPEVGLHYLVLVSDLAAKHMSAPDIPEEAVTESDWCFLKHADMARLHDHSYFMTRRRDACTQTTNFRCSITVQTDTSEDWPSKVKKLEDELRRKTRKITLLESQVKVSEQRVLKLQDLLEQKASGNKRTLLRLRTCR